MKKVALVTGGTDGIGKEIARGLANQGVRVIVVGRDAQKGRRSEHELRRDAGHSDVEFVQADLSLMQEVNRLRDEIAARCGGLQYLVLCAGVVRGRRQLTPEGLESSFAIGYLSRFVLTQGLMGLLRQSGRPGAAARILAIGGAARNGKIHYEDVNLKHNFGVLRAVSQLCEANDVFVIEQARRLAEAGLESRVVITALKAGVVRTGIRRVFPFWMKVLVPVLFDPFLAQTPHRVAAEALRLLVSPEFEKTTGALFLLIKRFQRLAPATRTSDSAAGRRLWDLSERLAGRKAPLVFS